MNNLQKYDDFINESIFPSRFRFLANRLSQYIKNMEPSDITWNEYDAEGSYNFVCRLTDISENDPYGEEENPNDVKVSVQRYRKDAKGLRNVFEVGGPIAYRLFINKDMIPISNLEAHSLYKELKRRKKLENEIKQKMVQDELYNKYKELDITLQKKLKK